MATMTADLARRLERISSDLKAEFPDVPIEAIQHDLDAGARELTKRARFNDFVPVLVHRAVRERLGSAA